MNTNEIDVILHGNQNERMILIQKLSGELPNVQNINKDKFMLAKMTFEQEKQCQLLPKIKTINEINCNYHTYKSNAIWLFKESNNKYQHAFIDEANFLMLVEKVDFCFVSICDDSNNIYTICHRLDELKAHDVASKVVWFLRRLKVRRFLS